ncbi:MAG: carboxylesterase/lipase family protein [Parvularculaceae bacterium]
MTEIAFATIAPPARRLMLLGIVALSSILSLSLSLSAMAAAPVVETVYGSVRGGDSDGVYSFKGIPFAAAPVGDLRWAPPAAPAPWNGVRQATEYSDACIQKPGLSAENGGDPGSLSEDCLYLNVWSPNLDPAAKLPVIVWIHGGAYVFGAGGLDVYDGSPSAKKGVVFVNFNYRLGSLGFFAHPSLSEGAYNFGLLDQVAALEWVKANIAQFGGDPENVTIMGQSAGGKSVMAHLVSQRSRGLFQKAVAMSVYILADATLEKAQSVANHVASAVGLNGADASLAELRAIPAEQFAEIEDKEASFGPVPIVGGVMLPKSMAELFAEDDDAPVPFMIGNTSDDASVISAFGLDPAEIIRKLGVAGVGLKVLYRNMSEEERARQALRDVVFTMNTRWSASRHSKQAPTWRYYFDYVATADEATLPNGAPHGYDVPFMLDTVEYADGLGKRYSKRDLAVANAMSGYLIEFARSGAPSCDGCPKWTSHKKRRDRALVIGRDVIELERNFMRHRLNALINVSKFINTIFG